MPKPITLLLGIGILFCIAFTYSTIKKVIGTPRGHADAIFKKSKMAVLLQECMAVFLCVVVLICLSIFVVAIIQYVFHIGMPASQTMFFSRVHTMVWDILWFPLVLPVLIGKEKVVTLNPPTDTSKETKSAQKKNGTGSELLHLILYFSAVLITTRYLESISTHFFQWLNILP